MSRYLIIASRFNEMITESLLKGAKDTFLKAGIKEGECLDIVWVPGAFEVPVIAAKAGRSGRYDAIVALGAVIRGDTPHFDYVAGEAASGLMRVSIETGVPVIFGILTTDTVEQALNRAGLKHGNKGADAAGTAILMAETIKNLPF
ncbi:MAG: 6,7-dimethyl-8-ribityllumazine synthase [Oligoflexales bacterium]|nr:6,7-dimethyl-8-ribityllumazine synthase [Oligoflexales bacterium]